MDKIFQITSNQIEKVNKLIFDRIKSDNELISYIANYLLSSGGKGLRPMLSIASSMIFEKDTDKKIIFLAAAVELIHAATLLHDDVVDKSQTRRGKKSANNLWGNQATILVGDYLFSNAFELMVKTDSLNVLAILSNASCKIAKGEILQLSSQNNPETSKEDYMKIITSKTAELFSAACKASAVLSSIEKKKIDALTNFGKELGISFQLIDDALDYSGNEEKFGKNIGDDFKTGKISLPIIFAYRESSPKEKKFWSRVIKDLNQNANDFQQAISLINKYDGIKKTYQLAKKHSDLAINALSVFKNNQIKTALIEIAKSSIKRSN